ncbi:hypothetical protein H310_04269 [Aphanomyces invadans]|uniref:Major facilitator superfamily (MFS) profile domain-containing protein n=1 Tax=Aphanomyces invadans TaxID=157072 RepID=A0A024UHH5_9STRA|nr:hypothetical protein H310_04269 [Aphanomyces invadans]ETW05317.1 hypothetical protein H310_04269 [Aphanomyces invadans]RHY32262.1 hypothetical protein DYB32_002712 [Aphanomyces invadans]|eukprot:XP_008866755.1 hypothetical protein H310_04269 [Aphanomyces invadans]
MVIAPTRPATAPPLTPHVVPAISRGAACLSPGGYANTIVTPKSLLAGDAPFGADAAYYHPPPPACSIPFMVFLAAPKMAMNMSWAAQWAAFGPLLETLLPSWAVQLVQIVGPLTGLLVAPTIGVLSDACTSPYGRRRPFLLFGAVASSVCWLVMSYAREIGEAMGDVPGGTRQPWTAVWTVLCYIWMDISVNMTQVPVSLILADFAGDRQVTAASIGQGFSIAGSFCVSGYILFFGPAHESIHAFMFMLVGVMLLTAIPVCIWAKEEPMPLPPNAIPRCTQLQQAFAAVYTGLCELPRVLVSFCVCFFLIQYGYTAYNGAKGQFFGLFVKGGLAEGANVCGKACTGPQEAYNEGVQLAGGITDTIFNGVGLVYLAILPWLVRTCGAKRVFTWSILPQALLIAMAMCKVVEVNVTIVVLCAITQNTVFAMQIPVIIHVVGHGPDNQLGLFAGAFNSANCAGQLLNFVLATLLVQTDMGHALPVLVGGILSLGALLVAHFTLELNMKSL